jgi:hypothetical protein
MLSNAHAKLSMCSSAICLYIKPFEDLRFLAPCILPNFVCFEKGEQRVHVWKTCACLLIGIDMNPILCVSPAPYLQNKISEKYMSSLRFLEHLVPR